MAGKEDPTSSTWAPLRITVFRWLWLASLASNVGSWMQTVGAQWFLVHAAHAAILVSLVQTADMLPDVMFGIVGGVLADTLDRRRLLMAVQGSLVLATSALAVLTITGRMTPALLLLFTFVIGTGSVLTNPAYQSLVPELVPRDQIPAAAQLSSININLARVIGPAVAGIPDRIHRGGGGLCHRRRDLPLLRPRGRSLAAEPGHHCPDPRAVRVGPSRRRPIRPLRASRPPDFAPSRALFLSRPARFGRCSHSWRAASSGWVPAGTGCYLVPLGSGPSWGPPCSRRHALGCRRTPSSG